MVNFAMEKVNEADPFRAGYKGDFLDDGREIVRRNGQSVVGVYRGQKERGGYVREGEGGIVWGNVIDWRYAA